MNDYNPVIVHIPKHNSNWSETHASESHVPWGAFSSGDIVALDSENGRIFILIDISEVIEVLVYRL